MPIVTSISAAETRARRLLFAGAAIVGVGLAVAGSASANGGGALALAGWLVLVAGLHFYGRAGSE